MLVALTSSGPYVGATTTAEALVKYYGFMHINMSAILIEEYAKSRRLPVMHIVEHKAYYRQELQQFGHECKFQTSPARFLAPLLVMMRDRIAGNGSIVIEKVRTDEQARYLKNEWGALVVNLCVSDQERIERASKYGVSEQELRAHLSNPVEQGVSNKYIDFSVSTQDYPAAVANEVYETALWYAWGRDDK